MQLGSFFIILFFILTLLTKQEVNLRILLYDIIILITSILAGMIGINKK